MTELRDARLRQALEEAPDARVRPQARTRRDIQAAAHAAMQPVWRRWWRSSGRSGAPWAAGVATLVVATLVTVLWNDEEVPGARPHSDAVAVAPPLQAPAISPAPAPPTPAAVSEPAPVPVPARPRAERQHEAASSRRAARVPAPAEVPAEVQSAAPAQTPAPSRALRERRGAAVALPYAAAPPAASAAVAGTPAPLQAERAAASVLAVFTQVRVEGWGKSVVLPADQARLLPALIVRLLDSPVVAAGAASGDTSLRLELANGDDAVGVLARLGEHWHWAPVDPAQPAQLLRPPASLDEDLEEEAARLLR